MRKTKLQTDGFIKKLFRCTQMRVLLAVVLGATLGSAQQPQNRDAGTGINRPVAESRAPRYSGDGAQDAPQSPRPGTDTRPNENGRPAFNPGRPGPGHHHPPGRPAPRPPAHYYPHPGRPHHGYPRANYVWGGGNGWRLRHFFLGDMRRVNRWHRHQLFVGGYFPPTYVDWIQPIPPHLMVYLPPAPPGYAIGYFDGYCMVYDPYTLRIESVIDLYRY